MATTATCECGKNWQLPDVLDPENGTPSRDHVQFFRCNCVHADSDIEPGFTFRAHFKDGKTYTEKMGLPGTAELTPAALLPDA